MAPRSDPDHRPEPWRAASPAVGRATGHVISPSAAIPPARLAGLAFPGDARPGPLARCAAEMQAGGRSGSRAGQSSARGAAAPAGSPPSGGAAPRPPVMRKVEFAWLGPSGEVGEGARPVPALPAFEEAFAAFARGTLFATSRGLMAVEDLWPGIEVRTAAGAMRALLWRGSTTVVPQDVAGRVDPAMARLTRISADALGIARPMQDLVLGPHARVVRRGPAVRDLTGGEAALVPAFDLADGVNVVVVTPVSPVQVFHLGFDAHERLEAHGVEVESQHPGTAGGAGAAGLTPDLLALWLSCFPHRRSLADWGPPILPRVTGRQLGLFDAA